MPEELETQISHVGSPLIHPASVKTLHAEPGVSIPAGSVLCAVTHQCQDSKEEDGGSSAFGPLLDCPRELFPVINWSCEYKSLS